MPRTAKPQANRTDLLTPGPQGTPPGQGQPNGQPVQVPTGGAYGEAQQLQQAQQAVPLPQSAPSSTFDMQAAMAAAKNFQKPSLGALTRPTERPNEPVTAGLPGSPVQPPAPRQTGNLSSMISAVAQSSNSAALSQLAARAAAAGQ